MSASNEYFRALSLTGTWGKETTERIVENSIEETIKFFEQIPVGDERAKEIMKLTTKLQLLADGSKFNGEVPFGD
jgi:hypothetical protein